jgi:cobalamin biosynthesis Mg chelatase CobN
MSEYEAGSSGPAIDRHGNPVIDPTKNVLDLVAAAIQRQDDLRGLESAHIREVLDLRGQHTREMREAEAERLDAIRANDAAAAQRTADVLATQVTTLAAQTASDLKLIQTAIDSLRQAQYQTQGEKAQTSESRSANTYIVAILGTIGTVLIIGLMATTLYFSMRQRPSSNSTVVCNAIYHPPPCP